MARPLDRVGIRGQREIDGNQGGRDHHAAFEAADAHGLAELLRILEQPHRAFEEAEVHHRSSDLAVLDEEEPVAREPGMLQGLLIHEADVPEVRDEQAAFHAGDELLQGLVAALENQAGLCAAAKSTTATTTTASATAAARSGLLAGLLGPIAIVGQ